MLMTLARLLKYGIVGLVTLTAISAKADWKYNPFTGKQDYFESNWTPQPTATPTNTPIITPTPTNTPTPTQIAHTDLRDMPSSDNADHDGRYYTESEVDAAFTAIPTAEPTHAWTLDNVADNGSTTDQNITLSDGDGDSPYFYWYIDATNYGYAYQNASAGALVFKTIVSGVSAECTMISGEVLYILGGSDGNKKVKVYNDAEEEVFYVTDIGNSWTGGTGTFVGGLIMPSGTSPSPNTVGAIFLDTDESANGSVMVYANGGWRKVCDLP